MSSFKLDKLDLIKDYTIDPFVNLRAGNIHVLKKCCKCDKEFSLVVPSKEYIEYKQSLSKRKIYINTLKGKLKETFIQLDTKTCKECRKLS